MSGRPLLLTFGLLVSAAALGAAQATFVARFAADTGAIDTGGADTGGVDTATIDTATVDTGGETDPPDTGGDSEAPAADTGELDTAGEALSLLSAAQVAGEKGGFGCSSAGLSSTGLWAGLISLVALGGRRRRA